MPIIARVFIIFIFLLGLMLLVPKSQFCSSLNRRIRRKKSFRRQHRSARDRFHTGSAGENPNGFSKTDLSHKRHRAKYLKNVSNACLTGYNFGRFVSGNNGRNSEKSLVDRKTYPRAMIEF